MYSQQQNVQYRSYNQPRQYQPYTQNYAVQSVPHHHHYLLLFTILAFAIIASFLFFKYYTADASQEVIINADEFGGAGLPPLPNEDEEIGGIRSSGNSPPALPDN